VVHPHPNAKIELETEFFAQTALAEARTHSVLATTPSLRKQTWHMTHLGEWLRVENEVLAYENTTPPEEITKQDIHESGRLTRGTSSHSHSSQECFLPRGLEEQGVA
jgi:hypothetical protein